MEPDSHPGPGGLEASGLHGPPDRSAFNVAVPSRLLVRQIGTFDHCCFHRLSFRAVCRCLQSVLGTARVGSNKSVQKAGRFCALLKKILLGPVSKRPKDKSCTPCGLCSRTLKLSAWMASCSYSLRPSTISER